MNPKVDFFFDKAGKWLEEAEKMRMIPLDCGLVEELKWGCPCYTYQHNNIVLIQITGREAFSFTCQGALIPNILLQKLILIPVECNRT